MCSHFFPSDVFLLRLLAFVFSKDREERKRTLLTKKLKTEDGTRESTLGFALNFYDALTDKAAAGKGFFLPLYGSDSLNRFRSEATSSRY